jgi:bla regulator protein blaR1
MSPLIQYLIKLSLSLAVVYLFYRFVLRPLTFYTWNRWYLIGYSLIAFVIPFVDINPFLSSIDPEKAEVINFIPAIGTSALKSKTWLNLGNGWNILLLLIIVGVVVMLVRFSLQFLSYKKLRRSSTLLSESPVKVFEVKEDIVPFSFGNSIFINTAKHGEEELRDIILHEFIHVKQKHTADMLWAEVLCILNWYNPFAWMIKKVICQNLEFIADQQVLNNGLDRREYQYLLLKVAGGASFRIANQFNFSFLKKRIAMMNKIESAKLNLVKFLFILPLMAVLLLSFRQEIGGMLQLQPVARVNQFHDDTTAFVALTGNQFVSLDTVPGKTQKAAPLLKTAKEAMLWKDTARLFSSDNPNPPLFIVDEIIEDYSFVQAMDPETIESIQVLKDKSALQYGEKGKYGVVRIQTKTAGSRTGPRKERIELSVTADKQVRLKNLSDSVTIIADSITVIGYRSVSDRQEPLNIDGSLDQKTSPATLRIKGLKREADPLYIVDGKLRPKGSKLDDIDPNDIESLSVFKGASAVQSYGSEAANGVILVVTKSGSKESRSSTPALPLKQLEKGTGSVKVTDSVQIDR